MRICSQVLCMGTAITVSSSLVWHDKSLFKAHSPTSKSGSGRLERIFSVSTRNNGRGNAFGNCLESGAHFFSLRLAHTNTYLSCQSCQHQKSLQTYGCSNRTLCTFEFSIFNSEMAKRWWCCAIEPIFEHVEWHRSVVGGGGGGGDGGGSWQMASPDCRHPTTKIPRRNFASNMQVCVETFVEENSLLARTFATQA